MPYPEDEFAPDPMWDDRDFDPPVDLPTDEDLAVYGLWAGLGGRMTANNVWGTDVEEVEPRQLIAVLQEWATAMCGIEGTPIESRFPDPGYKWRWHTPSMADIDELFEWLSRYIANEWRNWGHSRGFEAPIDFSVLAPAQRLAMMQDLDRAMLDEPGPSSSDPHYF